MTNRTSIQVFETTRELLKEVNTKLKLKCKTYDEMIQKLIIYAYQVKDLNISVKAENIPKEDESIKCINRIFHDGSYWCVHKPPKMVKLPTLDICKVCTARKRGLKDKTKVVNHVKQAKNHSWRADRTKGMEKYGMVFCPEGLWVYPRKCESCKNTNCKNHAENPQKRKERERQKFA